MSDEVVWQVINQNFCSYKVKLVSLNIYHSFIYLVHYYNEVFLFCHLEQQLKIFVEMSIMSLDFVVDSLAHLQIVDMQLSVK